MRVTCTRTRSNVCSAWTITPATTLTTGTDPNLKSVNKLLQIDPNSDVILADLGDYYLSFVMTLTS